MSILVKALLVSLALLVAGCASSGAHADANPLTTPSLPVIPEVTSANGVATLTLRAALDQAGRPAFFWQGREIAPTIRVRPGDLIRLHYVNDLPQICGLGMVSESNLHFHGLTLPPTVHSDDVIATDVAPGHAFDYTIKVGTDQPPGLYWYHPHPHGLANWEIGNGMSGAIVVEGIADELPSLAGLREQVIVLRDIPLDSSVAAAERLAVLKGPSASPPPPDPDEAGPPCGLETEAQPTINGRLSATIGIAPGERQLWRILNASGHRHFDLAIPGATMTLVAQDGIPLGYYGRHGDGENVSHVLIPPGGRAEVVVRGPSALKYLVSRCYDAGPNGDINPQAILAALINDHGATTMSRVAAPFGLHPAALYRSIAPAAAHRTIFFDEDQRGFYLDHSAYDPRAKPAIVAHSGTTEEWTLVNETDEVHTFHIHEVHFIVEGRDEHWLDTIDIPPQRHGAHGARIPSRVRVIVDFRDPAIRGTFVFHCHILDHEDGGMMAKIEVV